VRSATDADDDACVAIAQAVPGCAATGTTARLRADLRQTGGWVATDAGQVVGFVVVRRRLAAAEIRCMAVEPSRQGTGVGTVLVEAVLADLGARGVRLVAVRTPSTASARPRRGFFEARGFVPVTAGVVSSDRPDTGPVDVAVAALGPTVGAGPGAAVDRPDELAELRAELARLRADRASLLRRTLERDYERPPHYL
jgi:N-acetylglutamate synthase-like GNAT family acetyltransferase